jgi:CheY-like chemotaxis protein
MPDTEGLALAAKLREQAELAATPIILLTSGDRPGDLVRSRELGIKAHLFKPVQQHEVLEAIYEVMNRTESEALHSPAPAHESTPPVSDTEPLRILVAEDNEFNKQHLEGLLARRGHKVSLADNGREALALLGITGDEAAPGPTPTSATGAAPLTSAFDLLLLDLQMPEVDGFQVVRAIREREQATGGRLPVIALTARSRIEDRERCLAAGMDDYLAKPVRSVELFAAIERAVPSQKAAPFRARNAGDGARLLDPVVLLAACGDDAEGLRRMCESMRSYLPARIAEARQVLQTGDAPRLRTAAHKLCGLLSAFSTVAGATASDLEDHASRGRLEAARPLAEQLETMAQQLMEEVQGLSIEALRAQARASEGFVITNDTDDTRRNSGEDASPAGT